MLQKENLKEIGLLNLSNNKIFFDDYSKEKYLEHIDEFGKETVWAHILDFIVRNGETDFLCSENFGEMYEAALALEDKKSKKKSGQYYTPKDVSKLMANWLIELDGENVCDVGCGTGNLILAYLENIGNNDAIELLENKKIYLYDFDKIALTIARYSIALKYGLKYLDNINTIYGDFLDKSITLPNNAKVISNPPYSKFDKVSDTWSSSLIQDTTRELYAAFMEKIISSGNRAVIITPYSFLGGNKFKLLREMLSSYNGFIVAFDNVPGNIFNGRKHGVFNTNTANSVRAAITVVENIRNKRGFRTTPLIRFKNEERNKLLDSNKLKKLLSKKYQISGVNTDKFVRCHLELEDCFDKWKEMSNNTLKELTSEKGKYNLYTPNTCRYFTTASIKKLKRGGYITIKVDSIEKLYYLYCMINSSFVYWWWRIYDGGITYPVGLLNELPVFFDILTDKDKKEFADLAKEMIKQEDKYTITKLNAQEVQENIKFPEEFRQKINEKIFKIINCNTDYKKIDIIHKNSFF